MYFLSPFRMALVVLLFTLCPTFTFSQSFFLANASANIDSHCEASTVMGGGCAWFDYNNDGWEDVYHTGGMLEDALYKNNGDGTFTNVIFEAGFITTADKNTIGVVTGDIDNDGYREVFITTQNEGLGLAHIANLLYYNNGDGSFTDITESANLAEEKWANSATWLDANLDGFLDLYVGNYIENAQVIYDEFNNPIGFDHQCYLDDLYINNGDLTFTNAAELNGAVNYGCTLATAASDFNRDGQPDLLVANDFGEWTLPNAMLVNNDASFENLCQSTGMDLTMYAMGIAIGDVDEDLDWDYYFTNLGSNKLMLQTDDSWFDDLAADWGVQNGSIGTGLAVGWGTFFFDYNNDTYLDLFVSNGSIPSINWLSNEFLQENKLYSGSPELLFEDVSSQELPSNPYRSRGAAYADYNQDGALDFAVVSVRSPMQSSEDAFHLYQNTPTDNQYLSLKLEGLVCNADAFGSQVELYANDRVFLREVSGGSSYCSQNSSILHFGLGQIEAVDSVKIFWPGGEVQVVEDLSLNTINYILQDTTTVTDPVGISSTNSSLGNDGFELAPNPVVDQLNINWGRTHPFSASLQMLDVSGRLVWEVYNGEFSGQKFNATLPDFVENGVYWLVLRRGSGNLRSKKILVAR